MIELSSERIEQILHEETSKTEELATILRAIYTRYMRLFEKYFEDIDALNDDNISEFRRYHEETRSLIKCYYMDIPYDICEGLIAFDDEYNAKLLGPDWHKFLFDSYSDYKNKSYGEKKTKNALRHSLQKKF